MVWSAADSKSVMWSMESTSPIRINGVDVFVVDFKGKDLLRPQSPRERADWVVSIVACIGYGKVAVGESYVEVAVKACAGLGSGGGREKSLDVLRRWAVGDSFPAAMVGSYESYGWICTSMVNFFPGVLFLMPCDTIFRLHLVQGMIT